MSLQDDLDPERAQLVLALFERYATGQESDRSLVAWLGEPVKAAHFLGHRGFLHAIVIDYAGLTLTKRLFEAWHAFGEHQDRDRLTREMASIQAELHKLLEHAARKG
jgi:hypothetical protein